MAEVKILIQGFTSGDNGDGETCPTITLVRDQGIIMVVDPGVLKSQSVLAEALKREGLDVTDVNLVFITHSHLDHYRNIGMFAEAKTVEYFGIWHQGQCADLPNQLSPAIKIIKTPGHNYDGLSLLVKTDLGRVAVVGDVFWQENSPENDPYASDQGKLEESRRKVLALADYVIPGHGPMFKVK
ncbi:MAG: MBL fold metallo-hydrolase [Patescibacteria group bacterium]|jgi:glyoxylase-like metal-dependent hydrolase (beta-lactamase superfamily II)